MRKFTRELAGTVAIVVVVFAVSSLAAGVWPPWAVVSSFSMEPTLKLGDIVILFRHGLSCNDLTGDVIVYRSVKLGGDVVHRVVGSGAMGRCMLITKGDNNPIPDQYYVEPPVEMGRVLGKVVLSVNYVGVLALMVRPQSINWPGMVMWVVRLVVMMSMVVALYVAFRICDSGSRAPYRPPTRRK